MEMNETMIRNINVLHASFTPDGELVDNFAIVECLLKRIDELEERVKWLEINWCNPTGEDI